MSLKNKLLTILSLLILSRPGFAQNEESFKESDADLRDHFGKTQDLINHALSDRFNDLSRSELILVYNVTKEGSYFTRELHRSGVVQFSGSEVDYLNRLKAVILKDYPHLDSMIQVYITLDPHMNAFATINNNVYVNVGLLSRVSNEAQLTYILCHEILHIVNEHIIKHSLNVSRESRNYGKRQLGLNHDIIELYWHSLSRKQESQADTDGLLLYEKTGLARSEAVEALKLLENANNYIRDIEAGSTLLFMSDSSYQQLSDKFVKDKSFRKKHKSNSDSLYFTHPDVKVRVSAIGAMLEDLKSPDSKEIYLLPKDEFRQVHDRAITFTRSLYAKEMNFISLFLMASSSFQQGNASEEVLNDLAYGIQGILFDHFDGISLDRYVPNNADSLLWYFCERSKDTDISVWALETLEAISSKNKFEKLKGYQDRIYSMIRSHLPEDSLESVLKRSGIYGHTFELIAFNELDLDSLDFEVSANVDYSMKEIRAYNETRGGMKGPGKTAIIGLHGYYMKPGNFQMSDFYQDEAHAEKLESRLINAIANTEKEWENKFVSYIPNSIEYNGEEYDMYKELNDWLEERIYFGNTAYMPYNNDEVQRSSHEKGIRYIYSFIDVEVSSVSFRGIWWSYLTPIVVPHYTPMVVANTVLGSTRSFSLAVVYDLSTGELVFWDRRTSKEPNTLYQLHMTQRDIFKNFFGNNL